MVVALLVALLVVPLLELAVIIEVGQRIGVLPTIALLLAVSVAGAMLVKHQGLGVWRRIRAQLSAGRVPTAEVVDGGLILLAGALLLTPGFLTDALGLLLLLPLVRALPRAWVRRRFVVRVATTVGDAGGTFAARSWERTRRDPPPPRLEPPAP